MFRYMHVCELFCQLSLKFYFHVYECFICTYVYSPYACLVPRSSEEGFDSPEQVLEKVGSCGVNALQEQQGCAEPGLEPLVNFF